MARPGFNGFLAHVHKGKDVPMSVADNLRTGAFASDADDVDSW